MDLSDIRKQIDELDSEILSLFERRMDAVRSVARIKREKGLPIFDPEREAKMLEEIIRKIKEPANIEYARGLIRYLLDVSKKEQQKVIENE
jgi:monofunctional chorismate mutase